MPSRSSIATRMWTKTVSAIAPLPGIDPKGAYFTRGSGHNPRGAYTEDPVEYQIVLDRLRRKWNTAAEMVPAPVLRLAAKKTKVGIIAIGSSDAAVIEALDRLAANGVAIDYLRPRGFPFGPQVEAFLAEHEQILVVEQNRDAQLKSMLCIETEADKKRLHSVLHYDGFPIDYRHVLDAINHELERSEAA